MQDRYEVSMVRKSVPFIDITEDEGIYDLSARLRKSHGKALVLVHPFFTPELRDLDRSSDRQTRTEFDSYAREAVREMHEFGKKGLPVIVFFESDYFAWQQGEKTPRVMKTLLENAAVSLERFGFDGSIPIYFIPTHPEDPKPLHCDFSEDHDTARKKLARRLYNAGLRHAYVGGAYFNYSIHGDGSSRLVYLDTDIARRLGEKRRQEEAAKSKQRPLNVLELIRERHCVGGVIDTFAYSHIDVSVIRATYPKKLPRRSSL